MSGRSVRLAVALTTMGYASRVVHGDRMHSRIGRSAMNIEQKKIIKDHSLHSVDDSLLVHSLQTARVSRLRVPYRRQCQFTEIYRKFSNCFLLSTISTHCEMRKRVAIDYCVHTF